MTTLEVRAPATPTTRVRSRRTWTRRIPAVDAPVWWMARQVARYPKSTAALSVFVTAASPLTLRDVTGVFVMGASAIGVRHIVGAGPPVSGPSLHDVAKFRKRKQLIRTRWVAVMTDAQLAKTAVNGLPDKRRPKLIRVTAEPLGVAILVDGSRVSAGVDAFLAQAQKLKAGFKAKALKIDSTDNHMIVIHLRYDKPAHFSRPLRISELPKPIERGHVVKGLDEDSFPIESALWLPSLAVGAQGGGKSEETWTILHQIVASRIPFRLRVFDPKGGQEFNELEDAAWYYERYPTKWAEFIGNALRALAARQAALRAMGKRNLTYYTREFPLDVMVIDELITAIAFGAKKTLTVGGQKMSVEDAFMVYLSTARAAGMTVLASTQLAQKDVIGKFRGLFSYITLLRVAPTEKEMVDQLLGQGASKNYPAHQLSAAQKDAGIGYVATKDRGVVKYRGALLTDRERAATVRGIADWSRQLRKEDA